MTEPTTSFENGQTVRVQDGRKAVVRFVGETSFSPGLWVGIELDQPTGKNDGSVQGQRYFDCKAGHGMFVRPAAITLLPRELPAPSARLNGGFVAKLPQPQSHGNILPQPQGNILPQPQGNILPQPQGNVLPRPQGNVLPKPHGNILPKPHGNILPKGQSMTTVPEKRRSVSTQSSSSGSQLSHPPSKPPAKRLNTKVTATALASRAVPQAQGRQSRPSLGNGNLARPSMVGTTLNRSSRPSITASVRTAKAGGPLGSLMGPTHRPSLKPRTESNLRSLTSVHGGSHKSEGSHPDVESQGDASLQRSPPSSGPSEGPFPDNVSPLMSPRSAVSSGFEAASFKSGPEKVLPQPSVPTLVSGAAATKEAEDLKMKLRLMEKKRMEDRDKLKSLERIQMERDRFESIIQMLQSKYQPQQQEMAELRKQLKVAEAKLEEATAEQAENDVTMEMATLDREMAEETAESLKTELEALKTRIQELELEVEVLKEENEVLGEEMSPEERAGQGWMQMERSNERLREALVRLRDMTEQQEADLKAQVQNLEADVEELSSVKSQLEETKEKLRVSEDNVDELKQQLEAALGAEEMIEELTDKNMNMSEQISELKATIGDLESLKELSDELEHDHVETEKQMQEVIDYKDSQLAEQARKSAQKDEMLAQNEYTLGRFRELVKTLQGNVEDLKASKHATETEAAELTSHSRAMLDLNMKLQTAAAKTQMKTIDMELQRLAAQEASEHLAIVQLFLPEAFQVERDSILTLLRFKRLAFKARLLHGSVKEREAENGVKDYTEVTFVALDVQDKLLWLSAICDRFTNCMSSCTVTEFVVFETALDELEPVERALDGWIGGLRRGELNQKQCVAQLQRLIAVISHLAEVHLPQSLENHANDVYMRSLAVQSYVDHTGSAMSLVKDMMQNNVSPAKGEEAIARELNKTIDDVIGSVRGAKIVIGKAARAIDDLKARCLSLNPDILPLLERCESVAVELKTYSGALGNLVLEVVSQEDEAAVNYETVLQKVAQATSSYFRVEESSPLSTLYDKSRTLTALLGELNTVASDLSRTVEFERRPAPWTLRARDLQASERVPEDVQEQIQMLKETIQESATQLRIRDQALDESNVKIELLEARTAAAAAKTAKVAELEKAIADGQRREKTLDTALDARNGEVRELKSEVDRLKEQSSTGKGGQRADNNNNNEGENIELGISRLSAETVLILRKEVKDLQGAVRHLREDNRRLRLSESKDPVAWLRTPLRASPARSEGRASLARSEGQDILSGILELSARAQQFDLRQTPPRRQGWRPANTTPQWHVTKQREQWEQWSDWKDEVVETCQDRLLRASLHTDDPFPKTPTSVKSSGRRRARDAPSRLGLVMDQADRLAFQSPSKVRGGGAAAIAVAEPAIVVPSGSYTPPATDDDDEDDVAEVEGHGKLDEPIPPMRPSSWKEDY